MVNESASSVGKMNKPRLAELLASIRQQLQEAGVDIAEAHHAARRGRDAKGKAAKAGTTDLSSWPEVGGSDLVDHDFISFSQEFLDTYTNQDGDYQLRVAPGVPSAGLSADAPPSGAGGGGGGGGGAGSVLPPAQTVEEAQFRGFDAEEVRDLFNH